MVARVRIERAPSVPRQVYAVAKELSRALDLPLADVRALLSRAPLTLPRAFEEAEAVSLAQSLRSLGAATDVVHPLAGEAGEFCSAHPRLDGAQRCEGCDAPLCIACAGRGAKNKKVFCGNCAKVARKKRRAYRARLAVWLLLLTAVCIYGLRQVWSRRPDWGEPKRVALILVSDGQPVDPEAIGGFKDRAVALEVRLREQSAKYLPSPAFPFKLSVLGPVRRDVPIPRLESDSFWALIRFNYDLWSFAREIDREGSLDTSRFDVRIYVDARPPENEYRQSVEGASQDGGSLGIVEIELATDSVDFGLFVAAHELFHTFGASDKYGPDGLALSPIGYADPERVPLFPQSQAEVMARGRPLSATSEAPPVHLDELSVGARTAAEIGWQ